MTDMPTIYPMRFPSIPAGRTPTSIDDLLPSTYMDRPSPFTGAMQGIGKMLAAKKDDLDQADEASLKFGPNVAPGQIAALNNYLFRRGGQGYGGVMNQDGTAPLQIPGGPEMTPFNIGGQVRAQTDAEQAAALEFKRNKDEEARKLAHEKMDEQTRQFGERMKAGEAARLETKANHDRVDARIRELTGRRLALTAQKQNDFGLAQGYHRSATTAYANAKAARTLAEQKMKDLTNNFTANAETKAKTNEEIRMLNERADAYEQEGKAHTASAIRLLDAVNPAPAQPAPPVVPQVPTLTFTNAGQNPRFPMAAYGTVNGVPGWYQKDAQGNKTKVE